MELFTKIRFILSRRIRIKGGGLASRQIKWKVGTGLDLKEELEGKKSGNRKGGAR